jgi:hypothetical protein
MEGLNKSYVNTPGGSGSRVDPSRARASAASLCCLRMWEISKPSNYFQVSYLLPVCGHAGVMAVRLSHDLIDDELRVSTDRKPLNPKLGGDAQTVDQ